MNNELVPFPSPVTGRIITVEITVGTKLGKLHFKALKVAGNSFNFNRKKVYSSALRRSLLCYCHLFYAQLKCN